MAKKLIKFIRVIDRFSKNIKKIIVFLNIKIFFLKIKQLLLNGLFSLLPIILTLYITSLLIVFLYNLFNFTIVFIPDKFKLYFSAKILAISLTVLIFLLLTIITGIIAKTIIGKKIQKIIESFFLPIPIVNTLYKSTKQLFKLISQKDKNNVTKIVFVEYPYKGVWAIAFLTGKCTPKLSPEKDKIYYTVFIPKTPNPTSGFLYIVEKSNIIVSNLTIDEAVKIIVSGGIIKDNESFEKIEKNIPEE